MTKPTMVRTETRRTRIITTMLRDFARTNQILSGQPVQCVLAKDGNNRTPAWTRGRTITFNDPQLPPMTDTEDYVIMTGLNTHERSHVMYTLAPDQILKIWRTHHSYGVPKLYTLLHDGGAFVMHMYNLLEDQRIETLQIAANRNTRRYLTAMFYHYLVDPAEYDTLFLLCRGRRYLPRKLRAMARRLYREPDKVKDISRIIDGYRLLNTATVDGIVKAGDLLEAMCRLFAKDPQQDPSDNAKDCEQQAGAGVPTTTHVCGDHKADSGLPVNGPNATVLPEEIDVLIDRAKRNDAKADASKVKKVNVKGRIDDNEAADDAADDAKDKPTHSDLDAEITGDFWTVMNDKDVLQDVERIKHIIRGAVPIASTTATQTVWASAVPDGCGMVARGVYTALRVVNEDNDPHWDTHRTVGRLNGGRAMSDPDTETPFDQWQPGDTTSAELEVVIALDVSTSMRGKEDELSKAAWSLKSAGDKARAHMTVYSYARDFMVVYRPDEKAKLDKFPRIQCGGNTNPGNCLVEARNIFLKSRRTKKVLIILTDGEWDGRPTTGPFPSHDSVITDMNRHGVLTCLVFLGKDGTMFGNHGCTVMELIQDMDAFPAFARTVLVKALRKGTARR